MVTTTQLAPGERRCGTCLNGVVPAPPNPPCCAMCGALHVDHFTTWPRELVPWLIGTHVGSMMQPFGADYQHGYIFLLRSVMTARQWGTRILNHAATEIECYAVATKEASRWHATGRPRLFGPSEMGIARPLPTREAPRDGQ